MQWIAPSEKDIAHSHFGKTALGGGGSPASEQRLDFCPVFGACSRFNLPAVRGRAICRSADEARESRPSSRRGSRVDETAAYHADGVLYLTAQARFDFLLNLPEGTNAGKVVNDAMRDVEKHNPQLAGVLPKTYENCTKTVVGSIDL